MSYSSILDNRHHVRLQLWLMKLWKEMISLFNFREHLHNYYHVFSNLNYWLDSYSKEYDLRNQVVMLIDLFSLLHCYLQLQIVMNHDDLWCFVLSLVFRRFLLWSCQVLHNHLQDLLLNHFHRLLLVLLFCQWCEKSLTSKDAFYSYLFFSISSQDYYVDPFPF